MNLEELKFGAAGDPADDLPRLLRLIEAKRIWLRPAEYATLYCINGKTLSRMVKRGDIPTPVIDGAGKSRRFWRFFDPVRGRYILDLKPLEHLGRQRRRVVAK